MTHDHDLEAQKEAKVDCMCHHCTYLRLAWAMKSRKMLIFSSTYKKQWVNPIDVNFHLQKSLEIFDQNSADKIWSQKNKEIKVSPIRVKESSSFPLCNICNW